MRALLKKELLLFFKTPFGWLFCGILHLILGYMFLSRFAVILRIQPQLELLPENPGLGEILIAPFYGDVAAVLLFATPLVTMRLLSEEQLRGTITLLLSAPLAIFEIVLGKFFGALLFLLLSLLSLSLLPLTTLFGTELDWGRLAACFLAAALLLALFVAIGLYSSSLTRHPAAAAAIALGILLFLTVIDWAAVPGTLAGEFLLYLAPFHHFENLTTGLIKTSDLAYFLLGTFLFLFLTHQRLERLRRWP